MGTGNVATLYGSHQKKKHYTLSTALTLHGNAHDNHGPVTCAVPTHSHKVMCEESERLVSGGRGALHHRHQPLSNCPYARVVFDTATPHALARHEHVGDDVIGSGTPHVTYAVVSSTTVAGVYDQREWVVEAPDHFDHNGVRSSKIHNGDLLCNAVDYTHTRVTSPVVRKAREPLRETLVLGVWDAQSGAPTGPEQMVVFRSPANEDGTHTDRFRRPEYWLGCCSGPLPVLSRNTRARPMACLWLSVGITLYHTMGVCCH